MVTPRIVRLLVEILGLASKIFSRVTSCLFFLFSLPSPCIERARGTSSELTRLFVPFVFLLARSNFSFLPLPIEEITTTTSFFVRKFTTSYLPRPSAWSCLLALSASSKTSPPASCLLVSKLPLRPVHQSCPPGSLLHILRFWWRHLWLLSCCHACFPDNLCSHVADRSSPRPQDSLVAHDRPRGRH